MLDRFQANILSSAPQNVTVWLWWSGLLTFIDAGIILKEASGLEVPLNECCEMSVKVQSCNVKDITT